MKPELEQMLREAVEEARNKAKEEVVARLIAVQQAQQAEADGNESVNCGRFN